MAGFHLFFSALQFPDSDFREWIDAYWAKDIQELFSVGKRYSFQKFTELLLASSSGQFEASSFAAPCELSRQTVANYLAVLEATFVVHVIRPYATHKATEIVMAPKVYGFDTGFTCYAKGWHELRKEDTGLLWEQCVLNELHAHLQTRMINYWRDKSGHEVDFILHNKNTKELTAIECKFSSSTLSESRFLGAVSLNFQAFRNRYPYGDNYIVASDIDRRFERKIGDLVVKCVCPSHLVTDLLKDK